MGDESCCAIPKTSTFDHPHATSTGKTIDAGDDAGETVVAAESMMIGCNAAGTETSSSWTNGGGVGGCWSDDDGDESNDGPQTARKKVAVVRIGSLHRCLHTHGHTVQQERESGSVP